MTINLPKEKWVQFLDDLNKRRFGWSTKIEVMNATIGDQVLSDGLPLNGFTVEQKGDQTSIEIALGKTIENHQSHNIYNPIKVAFLDESEKNGGIVEIEEENGTKTLVHIIEPMSVVISYSEFEIISSVV